MHNPAMATITIIPTSTPIPIPRLVIVESPVGVGFEEGRLLVEGLGVMFTGEDEDD
jgi:hypothetical protein